MQMLVTKDGSMTFYNDEYSDVYHSIHGAVKEAFVKFVEPCRIRELSHSGKIKILDICFGIGYNSCAAIDAAFEKNKHCHISIVALEKDKNIANIINEVSPYASIHLKNYSVIKELASVGSVCTSLLDLRLILWDAKEMINKIGTGFDAVFHDPFSPKKNPELWTVNFFKDVRKTMRPGGILATYSCATNVRKNLAEAGFKVLDGPKFHRRGPSTVAYN